MRCVFWQDLNRQGAVDAATFYEGGRAPSAGKSREINGFLSFQIQPQEISPPPTANLDRSNDKVYENVTGLVKAVIEMSSKIQPAPPEEYVPMVKVRGKSCFPQPGLFSRAPPPLKGEKLCRRAGAGRKWVCILTVICLETQVFGVCATC